MNPQPFRRLLASVKHTHTHVYIIYIWIPLSWFNTALKPHGKPSPSQVTDRPAENGTERQRVAWSFSNVIHQVSIVWLDYCILMAYDNIGIIFHMVSLQMAFIYKSYINLFFDVFEDWNHDISKHRSTPVSRGPEWQQPSNPQGDVRDLGFHLKWNMGFTYDAVSLFSADFNERTKLETFGWKRLAWWLGERARKRLRNVSFVEHCLNFCWMIFPSICPAKGFWTTPLTRGWKI